MREPQVDTFCRCVKKVKKTLKARPGSTSERGKKDRSAAEGRAIAICTKSVLQTKGRTLRKVRCRDKVLETQPMKGGVFKWAGADTPVFNKDPVGDWNGFPVMWVDPKEVDKAKQEERQKQLNALITKYDAVVRMVSAGDGEIPIHRMLKGMIKDNVPPFDSDFVKMHVNLWAGSGIYRVDEEKTYDKVLLQNDARKTAKLEHIITRFGSFKWYGLVARTQKLDVTSLRDRPRIKALCALLRVLLHIDGRIVHYDLHTSNMALMQDNTPVIHDVGRMKIRDVLADFAPWEVGRPGAWNKRILRNVLKPIFQWPSERMDYGQYFYIARFFKDLRKGVHNAGAIKFAKEVFPTPVGPKWEHNDMTPTTKEQTEAWEANEKAFEAWLDESSDEKDPANKLPQRHRHINWIRVQNGLRVYDASGNVVNATDRDRKGPFLYLDPPFETRYHQIARVFDILSVLKALSWRIPDTMAYYYARKAAVKIVNLLATSPPTATKRKVGDIIRGYLELTGTRNDYDGNTPEDEEYWATKYLDEVNYARSGPKAAPVPAADAAAAAVARAAAAEKVLQDAEIDAAAAHARDEAARMDLVAAKANLEAALKAAADAEAAVAAARAEAAGADAVEAIEVGAPPQPDALNDAVGSADIIAELNAVPIPVQMALDEAVANASEIVRQSEDADNSEVLIKKGMILSDKEVADEASAEAPADNGQGAMDDGKAPPMIKRLKGLLFEEAPAAAAKEEPLLVDAADLAEPKTGVTYEVGENGEAHPTAVAAPAAPAAPAGSAAAPGLPAAPKAGRRTPRRRGLPQLW